MATTSKFASQTLVESIDQLAAERPDKAWVSVPKDDNDLSAGFTDISYKQLSQAIDRAAHWLQSALGSDGGAFTKFAYEGPPDIRWAILAGAAAKTETVMLLPYPLMPAPAKHFLLKATQTTVFLHAETSEQSVGALLADIPSIKRIAVPSLQSWMSDSSSPAFPFSKPWQTSQTNPWLIFHTSGTTGIPKPVVYSHLMMTAIAQSETFPDAGANTSMSLFKDARVHSSIPMNHFVGMIAALASPVYLGTILLVGPARPPSPTTTVEILRYGQATGFAGPPFVIRGLCGHPSTLELMKSLKFVQWAGAPLDQSIGDLLSPHVQLAPAIGTTECGIYFTRFNTDPKDWAYYAFRAFQGIHFEALSGPSSNANANANAAPIPASTSEGATPAPGALHELTFLRSSAALWQQIFHLRPELSSHRTGDVFTPHPHASKQGLLWAYAGRVDDVFKLASGEAVQAARLEAVFMRNESVAGVLVGGEGRASPFVLVQLKGKGAGAGAGAGADANAGGGDGGEGSEGGVRGAGGSGADRYAAPQVVAGELAAANERCAAEARLLPELVIAADPRKPFKRSGKDSVMRKETLELYAEEIESAYARIGEGRE